MYRWVLRDEQWERIKDLLPGKPSDPGATARDNRRFVEAVLWIGRTGAPWRDLKFEQDFKHFNLCNYLSICSFTSELSRCYRRNTGLFLTQRLAQRHQRHEKLVWLVE